MSVALEETGGPMASETAFFVRKVDQFFDSLNVSSYNEGKVKRKPFLQPYRSKDDFRFKVQHRAGSNFLQSLI